MNMKLRTLLLGLFLVASATLVRAQSSAMIPL
jgi:hypothetical protein